MTCNGNVGAVRGLADQIAVGIGKYDPTLVIPAATGATLPVRALAQRDAHAALDRFRPGQCQRANKLVDRGGQTLVLDQILKARHANRQHDCRHGQGHEQFKQGQSSLQSVKYP